MKTLLHTFLATLLLLAGATAALAQPSFRTVANFAPWPQGVILNSDLVLGPDGSYYGLTLGAGILNAGTAFKITPAGVITSLASFDPDLEGSNARSLLLGSDGNFYGICEEGGAIISGGFVNAGAGTIFRLKPDGTLSVLHAFTGVGADGGFPLGLIQGADGYLYGVARTPAGSAEFFKISTATGVLTSLNSPYAPIGSDLSLYFQGSDTYLYGTASNALVKISPDGLTLTTLAQLPAGSQFSILVAGPNQTTYATVTTSTGGSIIQFSATGVPTTLVTFSSSTVNAIPDGGFVRGSDGNFYGAAEIPGSTNSIIYEATTAGVITPLYTSVGNFVFRPLQAGDGDLFWETFGGTGLIQRLSQGVVSTVHDFSPIRLYHPAGQLLQAQDGNFYGTATMGGANNFGGVYQVTPAGKITDLASFTEKCTPYGLTQTADGTLYGVTSNASDSTSLGSFFTVSPTGTLTTLGTFGANAGPPGTPLVVGPDGSLYGLTTNGGAANVGTFYRATSTGLILPIFSFDSTTNSPGPYAVPLQQLVLGKDNNFYAATIEALIKIPILPIPTPSSPGPASPTVFKRYSQLAGFSPTSLVAGPDGNLYGTTLLDGSFQEGTLFELTPKGVMTILQNFGLESVGGVNTEIGGPTSLAFGNDGNMYVTVNGGKGMDTNHTYVGGLLEIASYEIFSLPFGSTPGDAPVSIIQGTDGTLYGTTSMGGTAAALNLGTFAGSLFNVNPGLLICTPIGTPGTYNLKLGDNTIENVFDGDLDTYFDAPAPGDGDWVGLDLGAPRLITSLAFVPRTHYENRMIGGVFQASNTADFSSGVVNLTPPITTYPGDRFNTIVLPTPGTTGYRYVRYLAPAHGYGNINEFQVFGISRPPVQPGSGGLL